MSDMPQAEQDRMMAGVEMIRRTGAASIQVRYSDDEEPVVWFVVATYDNGMSETDASLSPVRAVLRLCERLCDGATCAHCKRPAGLDPDTLDTMPLNDLVCWYQYDSELKTFRRGCESDHE